jgi:hypothetical protein
MTIYPNNKTQIVGTSVAAGVGGVGGSLYFGRAVDTWQAKRAKKQFDARLQEVFNSTTPYGGGALKPENFETDIAKSIEIHDNFVEKWMQAGSPSWKRVVGWGAVGAAVVGGVTLGIMKAVGAGDNDDASAGASLAA